jgi:hypothetical protein
MRRGARALALMIALPRGRSFDQSTRARDSVDGVRAGFRQVAAENSESSWTFSVSKIDLSPLGLEGGIARALKNMRALANLLSKRHIPLIIAVYPWPVQLAHNDRESRHISVWREFCLKNCASFSDLFPAFFAEKESYEDWYDHFYIYGDVHFSAKGHALMFRELSMHLF